ncbi:phosphopantetheine-binding protein [Paenibacillus sp. FSL H8-0537]|uniref:phosphopantetheine-binding protein n=1 Tax=Paenibacillus sp. FSL H8-0537 TaxID=2921399 RepID=UPI0031015F9D
MLENKESIVNILAKLLNLEPELLVGLGEDADLTEQYLSSVLVVELVVELEQYFGLMIDDEDLLTENVSTMRKIGELISKYIEMQPSKE